MLVYWERGRSSLRRAKHCQTHLALVEDIVSKSFHCRHGKAYLFDKVTAQYVRPGATPLPPGGIPGQVRPPMSMGPPAGRGRGDWRPAGMKGALPMQKGFHPGYGTPAWGGNAGGRFVLIK